MGVTLRTLRDTPGVVPRQPPWQIHQNQLFQGDLSLEQIAVGPPLMQQARLKWAGMKPVQTGEIRHSDHMAQQPQPSMSQLTCLPKKWADTCLMPFHTLEGWTNKSQHCIEVQTQIGELLAAHQV